MNDKIIDGMKKEGKPFKYVMIFGYVFAILVLLSNYFIFVDKMNLTFNNTFIFLLFMARQLSQ